MSSLAGTSNNARYIGPNVASTATTSSTNALNTNYNSSSEASTTQALHNATLPNMHTINNTMSTTESNNNNQTNTSYTSVARHLASFAATCFSSIAAASTLILGQENFISQTTGKLACFSVNLSLGYVAGVTSIIDQFKKKDLPLILVQLGDSLATILSHFDNKTMNRGVWIGLRNIINFSKKLIPDKPAEFSSFSESLSWTLEAAIRYIESIRKDGFIKTMNNKSNGAFGITTSLPTILGSASFIATGDKVVSPLVRHSGGTISEYEKMRADNLENGRFRFFSSGVSMGLSSIADFGGQLLSKLGFSRLSKVSAFLNQALNNFGRFFDLEAQNQDENSMHAAKITWTEALSKSIKEFIDFSKVTELLKPPASQHPSLAPVL